MANTPKTIWKATHRFARISPYKIRLMVDLIRGRDVQDALNILKYTPNRGAAMVSKVLTSAIANANEQEADIDSLFVAEAKVDGGPVIKRFQPKDRGKAYSIFKRTSHVTVAVADESTRKNRKATRRTGAKKEG